MKAATISISLDLLQNWLPAGSKILTVHQNDFNNTVEVTIEHDSFDEVPVHAFPPHKNLMIHTVGHSKTRVEYAS